jgi:biotin operon repressor
MAKKLDGAAELSEQMTRELESRRARGGDAYPVTLGRLGESARPGTPPELVLKAAGKYPFSERAVVARKKSPDAPVALREDLERLAASPPVLEFALESLYGGGGTPPWPLKKVSGRLDKPLQAAFESAIERRVAENSLPETVGATAVKGKPAFYLNRQPPPKPPATELAERLLRALRGRRERGDGYPAVLKQLAEEADPAALPEVVGVAVKQPAFADEVLLAAKNSPEAPVALREDLDQFVASRQVLEFALEEMYRTGRPPWPLKKVSGKLDKPLQAAFELAFGRQVAQNALPETVGATQVKGKPALYLKRQPPAPPPPPPEVALSEGLVRVLEAQRRLGPESYPVRLGRLVELTGLAVPAKVLKAGRDREPFASRALPLVEKHPDPPVALAEDVGQAVDHPGLLEFLLEDGRTEEVQAFSVGDLKGRLATAAREPFADAVARRMASGSLPAGVGWIGAKKERLLFRLEDVRGARAAASAPARPVPVSPGPAAPPPEAAFDEAFTRLDRETGSNNFVSLPDLRQALPFERAAFDARLRQLREVGRYTLRAVEGGYGLTEAQRAAGITEDGTLFLFVSRRKP